MKKTKANISLHEMTKLKKQHKFFLRDLKAISVEPIQPPVIAQASKYTRKPPSSANKVNPNDLVLIGDRSISHTPPLLLTYDIFNKNVHNCLIDSGAYSNIMPRPIFTKLNITPKNSVVHVVQLDRKRVEFIGEMLSVSIRLSSNPKVLQVIDILVVDIPEFYGLILSTDCSENLHGYFATDWSHTWLPYNGKPNQI